LLPWRQGSVVKQCRRFAAHHLCCFERVNVEFDVACLRVKISPPRVPLVTILNDMNPSRTVVCLFSRTPGQETTHKFTGSGLDRIVVIGSDIPQLSLDDLRSAVAAKDDTWTIGGAVTVAPTCSVCPAANWISFEVWPGAPVVCTCSCWIACSCCR